MLNGKAGVENSSKKGFLLLHLLTKTPPNNFCKARLIH